GCRAVRRRSRCDGPRYDYRRAVGRLRLGADERQLTVPAAIQDGDRGRLDVAKHHDVVAAVERSRGVGDRHRTDRLPFGAQDAGHPDAFAQRFHAGDLHALGLRLLADNRDAFAGAAPFSLLPLPFDLLRLLRDLLDRLRERRFPRGGVAEAMQKFLAARMERNLGAVPVFLPRQHGLRRDGAVVQHPFELRELRVDEAPEGWRDIDVTTGEFEAHTVAASTGPSVDWTSESSALRGTSRSCVGRARALRAAGC